MIERWARLVPEMRANIDMIIHANFILVNNDEQSHVNITKEKEKQFEEFWNMNYRRPMTARNLILLSLCPQLYGMYWKYNNLNFFFNIFGNENLNVF